MSDFDLKSDEEKAEELKNWWKENGTSVIAGIALTIGGMFGYNKWQQYKLDQAEGASKIYAQINKGGADSTALLKKLSDEYGNTTYTALAELSSAKVNCEAGKTEVCISQLKAATTSPQPNIASIAKIHLARTLISTGKLDEAKKLISNLPAAYTSLTAELIGDIFYAKKDFAKAREAYDKAILSSNGRSINILKMKRDDLGS